MLSRSEVPQNIPLSQLKGLAKCSNQHTKLPERATGNKTYQWTCTALHHQFQQATPKGSWCHKKCLIQIRWANQSKKSAAANRGQALGRHSVTERNQRRAYNHRSAAQPHICPSLAAAASIIASRRRWSRAVCFLSNTSGRQDAAAQMVRYPVNDDELHWFPCNKNIWWMSQVHHTHQLQTFASSVD